MRHLSAVGFACVVLLPVGPVGAQTLHWSEHRLWPVRADAAVAHPVPGRLLLLEESGLGELMTWTVAGGAFVGRPDQVTPSRPGALLCLDTTRRRVVLVAAGGGPQPETWSYDGHRWLLLPTNTTPGFANAGIAYDAARDRVVLHGGQLPSNPLVFSDQTFEFDGSNWSAVASTPALGRIGVGLVHDTARARTVLFGGSVPVGPPHGGIPQQDTWEWNGLVWTPVPTLQTPGRRSGFGFAFDAARARVVLHGGLERMSTNVVVIQTDTWEFDGTTWGQVAPALGYGFGGKLVADEATGSVALLTGGVGGAAGVRRTNRIGTAWQPPLAAPALPWASEYLAYDGNRDRLVLHDGRTLATAPNTTWEWDGSVWTDRQPAVLPPARDAGAFAFDPVRGRAVLFGGTGAGGTPLADTWLWDGTSWTQATPATSPPPRAYHAMAFDLARQRMVLFGGRDAASAQLADTWEWDGTSWLQVIAVAPARDSHVMAYDAVRGRCVVHGGFAGLGADQQTWEYDGVAWSLASSNGPVSVFGSMVFDPASQRCLLHDPGLWNGPFSPQTYAWDGTSWQTVATAQAGPGWKLVHDSVRGQVFSSAGIRNHALTTSPASTARYGTGCAGSGAVLQLDAGQRPVLGSSDFLLELAAAPPLTPCALFVDSVPANVPIGAGCTVLLAAPQAVALLVSDGTGIAALAVPMPDAAALLGAQVFVQGAALDPAGAFGLVTTSNGQELRVGR